jgi:hypothetical protein
MFIFMFVFMFVCYWKLLMIISICIYIKYICILLIYMYICILYIVLYIDYITIFDVRWQIYIISNQIKTIKYNKKSQILLLISNKYVNKLYKSN